MVLPISRFFKVTSRIEVGGVVTQNFGRGLMLTTDSTLPAGGTGKAKFYTDNDAVRDDFDSDSGPAEAAADWFGFDPYPQGLYIGRWARETVATSLISGAPGSVNAIAVANATFRVEGADATVDLSGETTYAGIAAAVQTELRNGTPTGSLALATYPVAAGDQGSGYGNSASVNVSAPGAGGTTATASVTRGTSNAITAVTIVTGGSGYTESDTPTITINNADSGTSVNFRSVNAAIALEYDPLAPSLASATFTYSGNRFELGLSSSGELDPPYFQTHSAGSGTDISGLLGMAQANSPNYKRGSDAESPSDAVAAINRIVASKPTYLMVDYETPETYGADDDSVHEDLWDFAEAGNYMYGFTDVSSAARTAGETASLLAQAESAQLGQTLACVADADRRPHVGALAGLSSINWDQPASIITLFGKTLPGVLTTDISETEAEAIQAKRGNVYTRVGGLTTFIEGYTSRAGHWADAVAFTMWIRNELELNIWNAARASRRLTIAILGAAIDSVMRKGVRNGGIQPGRTVQGATKADIISTTGNTEFDGILEAGYLVHIGALADQTQVDIDNRMAPPIKIWAKGSEAIHRADVDLVFQN